MTIQHGQIAPDFEQDNAVGKIRFQDYLGSDWGALFSHPVARLKPEWDERHIKPIGQCAASRGWADESEMIA